MPAAVAPCHGSMRLVAVSEFNKKDTANCPFCSLSPKSERRTDRSDRYYLLPNHRAVGEREQAKIDWSDPLS